LRAYFCGAPASLKKTESTESYDCAENWHTKIR
jgi:hypothetical protein